MLTLEIKIRSIRSHSGEDKRKHYKADTKKGRDWNILDPCGDAACRE